jgi:CheY-like chemotaxis protein
MHQVLIVDDDPSILGIEAKMLESAGYCVQQAEGGAAAIERLKSNRPDLVLLDLRMPDIDGWGVLRFVRTMPHPPRVVVVSGLNEIVPPGDLGSCVAGYVHKPFNLSQLVKTCEDVLTARAVMIPASGNRRDGRRTFVVETTIFSENGTPLALGQLLEIGRGGFRLELAIPIEPGDPLHVAFLLPGREAPLQLTGRVRWRNAFILGVEMESLCPGDEELLQQFVETTLDSGESARIEKKADDPADT